MKPYRNARVYKQLGDCAPIVIGGEIVGIRQVGVGRCQCKPSVKARMRRRMKKASRNLEVE